MSDAALYQGVEERQRVINAGFFGQALFDLHDNATSSPWAARVGRQQRVRPGLRPADLPEDQRSYVVSDESFWPDALGSIKLRAAYGESGRAPGAFDAVKTWGAVGYTGQAGVLPAPTAATRSSARSGRDEVELGFEPPSCTSVCDGVHLVLPEDDRRALLRPAGALIRLGGHRRQHEPAGERGPDSNAGIELSLNGTVLEREKWGWDLGGSVYTNHSMVLDLGGANEFSAGGGWIKVGAPVMGIRGHMITNPREKADPIIVRDTIYGPQQPTLVFNASTTLRMPYESSFPPAASTRVAPTSPMVHPPTRFSAPCDGPAASTRTGISSTTTPKLNAGAEDVRAEQLRKRVPHVPEGLLQAARRNLSVPVARFVPRTDDATLTVSARNWYTWRNKDFPMFDPEMVGNDGFGSQNTGIAEQIPPAASLLMSLRISF